MFTQRFSLSTQKRRYCRLGKKRRLVLLLAWETRFPTTGFLPVTSHTLAMLASPDSVSDRAANSATRQIRKDALYIIVPAAYSTEYPPITARARQKTVWRPGRPQNDPVPGRQSGQALPSVPASGIHRHDWARPHPTDGYARYVPRIVLCPKLLEVCQGK